MAASTTTTTDLELDTISPAIDNDSQPINPPKQDGLQDAAEASRIADAGVPVSR